MDSKPAALLVLMLAAACGAPVSQDMHLAASAEEAPADGITEVTLRASLAGAPAGAVVTFTIDGPGLLTKTNAAVEQGVATVELYAPFESDLGGAATVTSTVHATASFDGAATADATVSFTVPTDGAPALSARAEPDRVTAGGDDVIRLVVDGRRLSSAAVTLSAAPAGVVSLPASITLDETEPAFFHGTLDVAAPASPADVTVHLSAAGAAADAVLHFVAPDAPQFDLSGTFAEVQYGVVKIGDLIFLDPDPQCVIAPTLLLSRIVQTGRHLEISSETCDVQMPSVRVVFVGESTTTVGPGFVDATNARAPGPLEVELGDGDLGPGAAFQPTVASFSAALVVGADLASPEDALPTTADDPRVADDDNDGNPGVTIHNSNEGDQYCVFRTRTSSMSGSIVDSDGIDGVVIGDTETNILNGGGGGLSPTVTGAPSPFSFRRVDGRNGAPDIAGRDGDPGSISCDDVKSYAAELMADAPPPDTSTACD